MYWGLTFVACEGPAGADGQQGAQGEVGPIGPAGEDGSVMWAGPDAPAENVGNEGDYYLNSTTGEFYGPKAADGWGNPIIVLMGEDGKDGQDGADGEDGEDGEDGTDGADGEDGSKIYAGTGEGRPGHPDPELGQPGDFYLNTNTYNLYGPKTKSGWGTPINIKGAKGNANVTRYIFPGYDFSNRRFQFLEIPNIKNESEMQQSAWLVYLFGNPYYFPIPGLGLGADSRYRLYYFFSTANTPKMRLDIVVEEGPGEEYDRIEVVRIEASNTEDLTGTDRSLIPDSLNTSDYEAVAKHYGFGDNTRISKQ